MSTRERRDARAARLEEWAEKREVKAKAAFDAGRPSQSLTTSRGAAHGRV